MSYYMIAFLLAVSLCVTAHGKTLPLNGKDNVTSLLRSGGTDDTLKAVAAAAAKYNVGNLDKTKDESGTSSAVQDWSLVCQQLCGAALGGTACTPYCADIPQISREVQLANADSLLASEKQNICPNLCGLQLGDDVCTCDNVVQPKGDTNVCATFCNYQLVTLAGCSPCAKMNKIKNFTQNDTGVAIKALAGEAVAADDDITTGTTTPNWTQVCAALCKTGDGGSLCNCDLSPFFV